jgi:hypothetical protein
MEHRNLADCRNPATIPIALARAGAGRTPTLAALRVAGEQIVNIRTWL